VPFGYEEAIGFMFGSEIRDKDGVAASVAFAELVISLHRQGKTAKSYLGELYQRYGFFQVIEHVFASADPRSSCPDQQQLFPLFRPPNNR